MENKSSKKSRTLVRIKVAHVLGLVILAVVCFAFPLTTFARGHESHLGISGFGPFPFNNNSPFQQICSKNRNDPSDSNNNQGDASDSNNGCNLLPFDPQAFQQQLLKFLQGQGVSTDIGNNPSDNSDSGDSSDSNLPFDSQAFQQQLLKFLQGICTDIGKNNCDATNFSTRKASKITNASKATEPVSFKIVGEIEQSGQAFGLKENSRSAKRDSKITVGKIKNLKDVRQGLFVLAKDANGNAFIGQIVSPNQSPIKKAAGLINDQGKPQVVTLTL